MIDDYNKRNMKEYLKSQNIPVSYYGPSKEKTYPDTPFNQINACNTGVIHSTGDIVVFMEDYEWILNTSLERWNKVYNSLPNSVLCTVPSIIVNYKPPECISDLTIWNNEFTEDSLSKCIINGVRMTGAYDSSPFDWEYGTIPMASLILMNGFDERFDYWREYPSMFFHKQCILNKLNFMIDPDHYYYIINHRDWGEKDNKLWHINRTDINTSDIKPLETIYARSPNNFDLGAIEMEREAYNG